MIRRLHWRRSRGAHNVGESWSDMCVRISADSYLGDSLRSLHAVRQLIAVAKGEYVGRHRLGLPPLTPSLTWGNAVIRTVI